MGYGTFVGIAMLILVILMIIRGVHIGISLLATSILGLWLITKDFNAAAAMMGTGPFFATYDYAYAVIPLFVLMGYFVSASGASRDLYNAGLAVFGKLPGGLGIVTIFANAIFGAVTGVSIASAAVFSKIAIPEMVRTGYSRSFSSGCVAGSSVLGMIIPPSVMMILFGILADEAIGKLFIAGVIPGLLLSINYAIGVILMVYLFPKFVGHTAKEVSMPLRDRFRAIARSSSVIFLIVLVLGGIYGGLFTPAEAGAIGCVGAMVVMIVKGNFNFNTVKNLLLEAGATICSVFLIFIGAQMFSRLLTMSGLVEEISSIMLGTSVHPSIIILGMLMIYMFLGCFLDVLSIMLITLPLFLPVIRGLGYDLIWFAVLSVMTIETGLMTPPFGMSPFVIKASLGDGIELQEVYKGSLPFLLIVILTICVVFFFPALSTWLPSKM